MTLLPALPIVIPLATAAMCLATAASRRVQRRLALAGSSAQLVASIALLATVRSEGIQVLEVGSWAPPFGISLVADLLSASMTVITAIIGLATVVYSLQSMDANRERFGYYAILQVLLMGVSGSFLTGDAFNLFVWFEVMLMSSFVLLALGGEQEQLEGALTYVTINLFSSALFLSGAALLYGAVGTLNLADAAERLRGGNVPVYIEGALAMLFLTCFGIKAAIFPLFFWLPGSYHTPPIAVTAVFAGLLTKVGVYALVRFFTLVFPGHGVDVHGILVWLAGFTMVTGVLGAAAQSDVRRILSFHIVSQIGYMVMGLALATPLALAGTVFYLIHHILVKTNLFFVSGIVARMQGGYELSRVGGFASKPVVAGLFLIPALSLAGIPPLSGFFAKLALVKAGIEIESYGIVAAALGTSLLTLYSMTKIWNEAFWKAVPDGIAAPRSAGGIGLMLLPSIVLASLTVVIGLGAGWLFALSIDASSQLLDPRAYVDAVLGSRR